VNRESSMGFEIGSSPENLVGIGETGGGCKIPKMTETGLSNFGF
jgi:hypothetical protein